MKLEKIATLKQKLAKAQENFTVAKHEFPPKVENMIVDLSQYKNNGILTDDDSEKAAKLCAKLNKEVKEFGECRLSATRIYDEVKKDLIEIEKEVVLSSVEMVRDVTIINNQYISKKAKDAQELKEKIERENNQKVEREMLPAKIKATLEHAVINELSEIDTKMTMSWASLTLEKFEERIAILKTYKAKVTFDKVLEYFKDYKAVHITQDEVDQAIRNGIDYSSFCEKFEKGFMLIKQTFINSIDQKREELKNQSEAQRKKLEDDAMNELIAKKAKEMMDKQASEKALLDLENTKTIQGEMETQVKLGNIQEVKGRTQWEVVIVGPVDWTDAIERYVEEEGIEKLQFLFNWLAGKGGRPEIKGIKYESSKKVINRR